MNVSSLLQIQGAVTSSILNLLLILSCRDNLGQQCLDERMDSMPRRLQACINARGRATGY